MLVADVNVLVDAHRIGAPRHDAVRAWLDAARFGDEQLAIPGIVASAFVRTVTNRRVFPDPASMEVALEFIDEMRIGSAVRFIEPGSRHWTLFSDLCRVAAATGDRVPDAWLAALAIENRATLITADLGFGRYPGLRWRDPLAVSARSIRSLDGEPAATGTDSRVPGVSAWQLAADAGRERRTAASGSVSSATISAALLDSIVAWSLAGRPNEACGLIAGTAAALEGGSATRFLPLTNAAASPYRYLIDPDGQLRAMLDIDDADEMVWGIVHSHVMSPAVPSDTDVGLAAYPDALHLICSLANDAPMVRAWSIQSGTVTEVELGVV